MTPSKASFSFLKPSLLLSQYSSSSDVFSEVSFNCSTWACSSSSVKPSTFSSVVAQSRLTETRSSPGGGGRPLERFGRLGRSLVPDCVLSTEPVESFAAWALILETDPRALSDSDLRDDGSKLISGSISFFCLEGGNISSKSTGTPRLTRKSRLIRDWVQLGGWSGGGVTSCFQRERERSEGKIGDESGIGSCCGNDSSISRVDVGNMASRCS